jgi:hypothetical protein
MRSVNGALAIAIPMILAGYASSSAQPSGAIPEFIVKECMDQGDASKLPECLKEGAYAVEMLDYASSSNSYGNNAAPVIDVCKKNNKSTESVWACFRIAAEKASETRGLIGLEKIQDPCVAGISDKNTYARLLAKSRDLRKIYFPREMFSGGNTYFPFRGCQ